MSRIVDALLGAIFIAAAYSEEIAERIADWSDEKLMDRQARSVTPDADRSTDPSAGSERA